MRNDLLRLLGVLLVIVVLLPLFAWIENQVGYRTFSWGALTIATAVAIVSVLVTVIGIRKEKK